MSMNKSRTPNEAALDFVSKFNEIDFQTFIHHLSSFVQDGFLKDLFDKNPSVSKDKAQILIESDDDDDDDDNKSQDTDDYLMDALCLPLDKDDLLRQGFQKPPNPVPIKLPSMPDVGSSKAVMCILACCASLLSAQHGF
ncbi:hypothetical protein RhiirC2_802688 [Rhizophagus irregularis]|uniref:Uncharacterized protein n=1 Tax=Rhizophagus irregularis TaxID=588596 RepID=A0A2N1M136_9GLOM|nr:hypothetical protein RhiirC2_802688 [Rhizophagus irregularis]